ncbi:MAG: hypothetical protein ACYS99_11045 [Planctomycetota bacterium]|jgi:hypothetical protein
MPKGSFGHLVLATTDLKGAKDAIHHTASRLGFKAHGRMRSKTGFVVSGIRGTSLSAMLGQMIPFAEMFGWFSRTVIEAKCQRSLDAGDDRLHLFVRVTPMREMSDEKETYWTQSLGERFGDNRQCRRVFREFIEELLMQGLVEQSEPTSAAPGSREARGPRSASPRRRGSSRRR